MCAKNHLLIFSSFLDMWENVEWPRFLDHPVVLWLDLTQRNVTQLAAAAMSAVTHTDPQLLGVSGRCTASPRSTSRSGGVCANGGF